MGGRGQEQENTQEQPLMLMLFSLGKSGVAVLNCVLEHVSLIKFNTAEQLNSK